MLHFDAHPDLACPHSNIPAAACYNPRKTWPVVQHQSEIEEKSTNESSDPNEEKDLYELLDATSTGIAEWILPLVLAASLSEVRWIRPTGQLLQQFPLGEHQYRVGAWVPKQESPSSVLSFLDLPPSALVKVDRDCPYYQDDDTSVPCEELLLPMLLRLSVAELPGKHNPRVRDDERSLSSPWMLDICLDYFACLNPFVTDIEMLDPAFARALCDCVLKSIFYTEDWKDPSPRNQDALSIFRKLLSEELQRTACMDTFDVTKSSLQPLLKFYDAPETGEHLLSTLVNSLRTSAADRVQMATLAVEALPNLTMPHDSHQAVCMEAILPSVQVAQNEIELHQHELVTNPFIITIARSSVDGFTPECVVEALQAKVLTMIHTMYCNCQHAPLTPKGQTDSCCLNLVFDYGQWEGSSF